MVLLFLADLAFQGSFRRNLIKPCIEQSEADITDRQSAGNDKKALTPAKKPWTSRGEHLAFSCEHHDRSPLPLLPTEVRMVRSNRPGYGPTSVHDPVS